MSILIEDILPKLLISFFKNTFRVDNSLKCFFWVTIFFILIKDDLNIVWSLLFDYIWDVITYVISRTNFHWNISVSVPIHISVSLFTSEKLFIICQRCQLNCEVLKDILLVGDVKHQIKGNKCRQIDMFSQSCFIVFPKLN